MVCNNRCQTISALKQSNPMGFGKGKVSPPLWEVADLSNKQSGVVSFIQTGRTTWWIPTCFIVEPKHEISGGQSRFIFPLSDRLSFTRMVYHASLFLGSVAPSYFHQGDVNINFMPDFVHDFILKVDIYLLPSFCILVIRRSRPRCYNGRVPRILRDRISQLRCGTKWKFLVQNHVSEWHIKNLWLFSLSETYGVRILHDLTIKIIFPLSNFISSCLCHWFQQTLWLKVSQNRPQDFQFSHRIAMGQTCSAEVPPCYAEIRDDITLVHKKLGGTKNGWFER